MLVTTLLIVSSLMAAFITMHTHHLHFCMLPPDPRCAGTEW